MNPYAAAGWSNPQNPYSINDQPWQPPSLNPPTFGALPPQAQPPAFQTFEFCLFYRDTLNCDVLGPRNHKFFEIRTVDGTTTISKSNGQFARIKWVPQPTLEFNTRGALATRKFLPLSSDAMYRTMHFGGKVYAWLKRHSGDYLMYTYGSNPLDNLAKINRSSDGAKIFLQMRSEAFQAALLEPCAVATVLLFCGLDID